MNRKSLYILLLPVAAFMLIGLGILLGRALFSTTLNINPQGGSKLDRVMEIISDEYVDAVDVDSLQDMAITSLMESLDPHSAYIPKSALQAVNDDLEGSFTGVGVSFQILADTVTVVEVIPGGPAEKVGILAGDRIVGADGKSLIGATNDDVFSRLRGKKGTKVKLDVMRPGAQSPAVYDITRDDIPVNSVIAAYLIPDSKTGYIKLSQFTRNTHQEFLDALTELTTQGATNFVLDLRGNPGGFMDQAYLIANEFLPAGRKIVYTKSRTDDNKVDAVSDGEGTHQNSPVAVLIDEYSASASEIIAGAIQDNDRGIVVGRRSFGKGLVQNQIDLPDSSAVRLTVARYYTPSGRCIQKEYKIGETLDYDMDILNRYKRGEFYYLDSIKMDRTKPFRTIGGRTVYGGGGILPDVFVPQDTTFYTSYYNDVSGAGLIQQFAFRLAEMYRPLLRNAKTSDQVLRIIPDDATIVEQFADFAESKGQPAAWYYINISSPLIASQLKSFVVRDVLGYNQFYEIFNRGDRTIQVAIDVLKEGRLPAKPYSK